MPDVRLPDGTIVKNVPEGTTKAQLMAKLGRSAPREDIIASNPAEYDPSSEAFRAKYGPTGGFLKNFDVGVGKAFTDLNLGAKQLAARLFGTDEQRQQLEREAQRKREVDAPLMGTGGGKVGAITGGVAATLPVLGIPGLNTIPGAAATGAGFGALQPATSDKERLISTGVGGALGAGGQYLGGKLGGFAGRKVAERSAKADARNIARQPINDLISKARAEGLVVPPSTANPSATNRMLEGFAGKLTTGQGASVMNQKTFNNMAKRTIGLADDIPLSKAAVERVRKSAGQIYDDISKTGTIVADPQYKQALQSISNTRGQVQAAFPKMKASGADQIDDLINGLDEKQFPAAAAIEKIKELRKEAKTLFKAFDDPAKQAQARATRKAADVLDDLLERHLQNNGFDDLAARYRPARQTIAKAHTIENALNEAGNINPRDLARQLNKNAPLTGDLELMARFADAFPKAARETTESFPGFSPLDFGFSGIVGGGALASGSPEAAMLAGLPALRALTRRGILSGPAQNALLTPATRPGLIGTGGLNLLGTSGRVAPALGIAGSPFIRPEEEEAF